MAYTAVVDQIGKAQMVEDPSSTKNQNKEAQITTKQGRKIYISTHNYGKFQRENKNREWRDRDHRIFHRGEIYFIKGVKTTGSEQGGTRPAILVGNEAGLKFGPIAEVVYMTTQKKATLPTHPIIQSGKSPSIALCEHVVTVDKSRILSYVGRLTKDELKKVDQALAISLQLEQALKDPEFIRSLLTLQEQSALVEALLAGLQKCQTCEEFPSEKKVCLGSAG